MKLPGHRIIKTTLAVFLTAYICFLLDWPAVFAVITAIVTMEPTVSASIKKGVVRFPASAIGAFYAVSFVSLFGNSPTTYTLAASLTIITCFLLRLHTGLLVATLTAVAMVETVHTNFLLAFLIRLGTTTIGLVVATAVNFIIFPPNYTNVIQQHIKQVYTKMAETIRQFASSENKQLLQKNMKQIQGKLQKTNQFIQYQKDQEEYVLQAFVMTNEEQIQGEDYYYQRLRLIYYHLSNITVLNIDQMTFSAENKTIIHDALFQLANMLESDQPQQTDAHEMKLRKLLELFWNNSHPAFKETDTQLPHELTILYELVTIFYIAKHLVPEKITLQNPELR
ncbi:MAG TPA: aromatic acid exporter family protein [Pseudogracilibacillus sp.]|nr:aromatic acid exporter family protein [Pseudogracilibacillus sp.]